MSRSAAGRTARRGWSGREGAACGEREASGARGSHRALGDGDGRRSRCGVRRRREGQRKVAHADAVLREGRSRVSTAASNGTTATGTAAPGAGESPGPAHDAAEARSPAAVGADTRAGARADGAAAQTAAPGRTADGGAAWAGDGAERSADGGARAGAAVLAPRARWGAALGAVYRAQLSRARVARIPLLFVATFQSLGIMILMRGVVDGGAEARAVVAGSSVLVVAFVALNLLAQYFGQLRATGGLDHYATLPVPAASVVLGTAAAYASFTAPGVLVTAVAGSVLFQLPLGGLWVLVAVVPLTGAALSGLGAALGLLAPRPELATLCGQLGMSAALLLGVVPGDGLPAVLGWARDLLPSTYGVEALARTFEARPDWGSVLADLTVCAVVGVLSLALATRAYRRAATR